MEGFLLKKGRGESGFGRRNWKRRWFILEDNSLKYFEDFNIRTGQPISLKGVADLTGCEVFQLEHKEKDFCFMINHPERSPMNLQAETEKSFQSWMKAITSAINGDYLKARGPDYPSLYALLGLSMKDNPTTSEINRAYRKAALRVHPDKGGDLAEFKKLQGAFDSIILKLEEEENNKLYTSFIFEAKVRKGPEGVGLGMIVVEDLRTGAISIKQVTENIMVESISDGASEIQVGDAIIKIENEDIVGMPLLRAVQKIADFRVPVNSVVRLTFSRKVKIATTSSEGPHDTAPASPSSFSSEGGHAEKSPAGVSPSAKSAASSFKESTPFHSPGTASHPVVEETEEEALSSRSHANMSHLDPVRYVAVIAENEELKAEVEVLNRQLDATRSRQEEVDKEFAQVNERHLDGLRTQRFLEMLLQQQYLLDSSHTKTGDAGSPGPVAVMQQIEQSSHSVIEAIRKRQSSSIPVSRHTEMYLKHTGLSDEEVRQSAVKTAQREAIIAAAAVDGTGKLLQKWEMTGDSALDKLFRLEDLLQSIEAKATKGKPLLHKIKPLPTTRTTPAGAIMSDNAASMQREGDRLHAPEGTVGDRLPLGKSSTVRPSAAAAVEDTTTPRAVVAPEITRSKSGGVGGATGTKATQSHVEGDKRLLRSISLEMEQQTQKLPQPERITVPNNSSIDDELDFPPDIVGESSTLIRAFETRNSRPQQPPPKHNYFKATASSNTRLKNQSSHSLQGANSASLDYHDDVREAAAHPEALSASLSRQGSHGSSMSSIPLSPITGKGAKGRVPVVYPTQK